MKTKLLFVLLAMLSITAAADGVYLRAGAQDGGDGLSWESAFNDLGVAVEEAVKSENETLYISEGVYQIAAQIAVTNGLSIMGGYSSDGSVRDTEVYQTIFTGDTALNDTWAHVVPKLGEYALEETLTELPVIADGKFSPPPAYTDKYDCYVARKPSGDSNASAGLMLLAGTSLTVDGVWFIGFDGQAIASASGAKGVVNDCRFYACTANGGGVAAAANSSSFVYSDCSFRYLAQKGSSYQAATGFYFGTHAAPKLVNCDFESIVGPNAIKCEYNASPNSMSYLTMTRCVLLSSHGSDDWGFGSALGLRGNTSPSISDSIFTNNLTMSTAANAATVFNLHTSSLLRCLFEGNRLECKAAASESYILIGSNFSYAGTYRIYSCVFRENVVAAISPASSASTDTAMLAILGCGNLSGNIIIANSQFEDNAIEAPTDGMQYLKATGVGNMNLGSGSQGVLTTIVNCTFLGSPTEDAYEVIQYGLSVANNTTLLNCLFMNKYGDAARPLWAQCAGKTDIQSCTMQGVTSAPDGMTYNGLKSSSVLFEECGDRLGFVRPAVRVDAITDCVNVYTNSASSVGIVYKNAAGERINVTPTLYVVNNYGGTYCDAFNNTRPADGFRRGAVQVLSEAAETQCAITVSCEPASGGTVDLAAQNVPAEETVPTITATPADGCEFIGWYLADNTCLSTSTTLSDYVALTDTNIVAKFTTPAVTLTFDLGKYGSFAGGDSTYTVSLSSGTTFPSLPVYGETEGWYIYGWEPALPDLVPEASTTYSVKAVEKRVRIVYAVPNGEGVGRKDGSSWDHATDDLAAAYANAGIYKGEVWLKEGLYHLGDKSSSIRLIPNVTIRGGFRGIEGETAADARPREYRTVITGDINGDDYWKPNGATPADTAAYKIFQGERGTTFNTPNPDLADNYWMWNGSSSDNASEAFFATSDASFTNSAIVGITFTGFTSYAVSYTYSTATTGIPEIRSCDFLGGGHGINVGFQVKIEDCSFVGLRDAIYAGTTVEISGSRFDRCYDENGNSEHRGSCLDLRGGAAYINDTIFYGNYATGKGWRNAVLVWNGSSTCVLSNCVIEANNCNDAFSLLAADSSNARYKIYDTLFLNNRSYHYSLETAQPWPGNCLAKIGGNTIIQNTSFISNSMAISSAVPDGYRFGNILRNTGNVQLLNCTLLDNTTTDEGTGRTYCNAATIAPAAPFVMAYTTIDGSELVGDTVAEIYTDNKDIAIVNSLIESERRALEVASTETIVPTIYASAIKGFDASVFTLGADDVITGLTTSKITFSPRKVVTANGAVHKGLPASSPLVNSGEKVYLAPDGNLYIYDEITNPDKPWRKLSDKTSYSATITGLSKDAPYISDAVYAKRTHRRNSPGSVNATPGRTLLKLQ